VTKRRRARRTEQPSPDDPTVVHLLSYEITYEPILDRQYRRLPRRVKDAVERLHDLAQSQPLEAIPELREWIQEYPDVPAFYNYLSAAYTLSGQKKEAEEAIRNNFRRNPEYLFARLNYGELCLSQGDLDRIPELFDHKFDLKLLYPKRSRFHVSEALGFMGLMGAYFCEIGERDMAQKYYQIMNELDPQDPQTRRLRRKLHPGPLGGLQSRLANRS